MPIERPKVERSGSGVFLHNGEMILLVHQAESNFWSFPKGGQEPDENSEDCWKRELFEETGIINLPPHRIITIYEIFSYEITVIEILSSKLPIPIHDEVELLDARWIPMEDIDKYHLNSITRNILKVCLGTH